MSLDLDKKGEQGGLGAEIGGAEVAGRLVARARGAEVGGVARRAEVGAAGHQVKTASGQAGGATGGGRGGAGCFIAGTVGSPEGGAAGPAAWSPELREEEDHPVAWASNEEEHREEEKEQGGHWEEERLVAPSPEQREQREEEAVAGRAPWLLFFQGAPLSPEGSGWSGDPEKYRPILRYRRGLIFGPKPVN
jgi:hypothetical protein